MLQNQPQEISSGNDSVVIAFGFAVNITEGDLAIMTGQNIFFPDHPPGTDIVPGRSMPFGQRLVVEEIPTRFFPP